MVDDHHGEVSPDALYQTREEAVAAPGVVFNHFKGGVYRTLGTFYWQDGEFVPKQGDRITVYEHLFPHEHGYFARHAKDFRQHVEKPEVGYSGPRFAVVDGWNMDNQAYLAESFDCECKSPDHTFKLSMYDDEQYPQVYMQPYLTTYNNFWQRLKQATKYLFKNQRGLGKFDDMLLTEKDLLRLQKYINYAVDKITNRF